MSATVNRMILRQLGRRGLSNEAGGEPAAQAPSFDGGARRPIPSRDAYDARYGPATAGDLFRMALSASRHEQRERLYSDGRVRGVERD